MIQEPAPAERPLSLRFLPRFLFRPEGSKFAWVLKAWLLVLLPSILLSVTVRVSVPSAQGPDLPLSGPVMVALVALVGPLLETLIMGVVLLLFTRFMASGPAVWLSSICWGVAHSWGAPTWGLVAWWPFLIFSTAFLTWRERGLGTAILIVTAIHALQNSFAVSLLLLGPFIDALTRGPI
jgi:membrane protease YdiL (CAAX protease family)